MHVVGSANGHPEMIWATFEHKNNAPAAQFTFLDPQSKPVTIPQDTTGNWLFSVSNPPTNTPFNQPHMKVDPSTGNIDPIPTGGSVSPSSTIRSKAWGSASNTTDPDPIQANTDIISINTDILNSLASGDLRSNYILIGATWTDGTAPTINPGSSTNTGGNQVGTNMLSNSTMETYHQDAGGDITSSLNQSNNCFSCHSNNGNFASGQVPVPNGISHIFGVLLPLFTAPATPAVTPTP
jgi:hypothetical protein